MKVYMLEYIINFTVKQIVCIFVRLMDRNANVLAYNKSSLFHSIHFILCCSICAAYLFSMPFFTDIMDIDQSSSYRVSVLDSCSNVVSESNTSLHLAYISGLTILSISIFMWFYISANGTNKYVTWPTATLWVASILFFIAQMIFFFILVSRITIWFMSCENAAKTGGSCPTTRFEKMRFKLTDKEQCNFASDLTLWNSENDLFKDCQDTSALRDYNAKFSRWDLAVYYKASTLCTKNDTNLPKQLSWCYYYGCSQVCTPETYNLNWRWIFLDALSLLTALVSYLLVTSDWYIIKNRKDQ